MSPARPGPGRPDDRTPDSNQASQVLSPQHQEQEQEQEQPHPETNVPELSREANST